MRKGAGGWDGGWGVRGVRAIMAGNQGDVHDRTGGLGNDEFDAPTRAGAHPDLEVLAALWRNGGGHRQAWGGDGVSTAHRARERACFSAGRAGPVHPRKRVGWWRKQGLLAGRRAPASLPARGHSPDPESAACQPPAFRCAAHVVGARPIAPARPRKSQIQSKTPHIRRRTLMACWHTVLHELHCRRSTIFFVVLAWDTRGRQAGQETGRSQ